MSQVRKTAFATLVRECRAALGFSQGELGSALNVADTTVTRWERGELLPRKTRLPALAWQLQCPLEDLEMAWNATVAQRRAGSQANAYEMLLSAAEAVLFNSAVSEGANNRVLVRRQDLNNLARRAAEVRRLTR